MHLPRQEKSLMGFLAVLYVFGVVWCSAGDVWAEEPGQKEKMAVAMEASGEDWKVLATSPGVKVVAETTHDPGGVVASSENPMEVAYVWLDEKGLDEGRNLYHGKLLYVSLGSAIINASPSDPAFIDSRFLAYQRAEIDAKAKTAIFLGVDLTTSRGSSEREINPQERKELEAIVAASPSFRKNMENSGIGEDIHSLLKKTTKLAHAKLDQALQDSGVDIQAEKKRKEQEKAARKAERDKLGQLRNISENSFKAAACAMAEIQGTQIVQSYEGSIHGGYEVVVVTLWSKNMQKLVDSMISKKAPASLTKKQAKKKVAEQLPKDPAKLACLTGVRAFINEAGEHILLAFGQSGVRVIGGREDKAYELAGKKARNRAMSAMRAFMGERVVFNSSEKMREVLALYVDEHQDDEGFSEYKSVSQFQEMIRAEGDKQKIRGLHGLLTKEFKHPFTDKPLVMKIMAWSPSSQALAAEIKRAIEVKEPADKAKAVIKTIPKKVVPSRKGLISSGEGADPDAF